ncbi:MAG: hypothetical protein Greene041614_493 [Parcubacteria group bacterium Greene0416_14]|nr:MAG: hypothetical protein Greene041614_493 [Parcubacteria group bacterium Greene0416_14]
MKMCSTVFEHIHVPKNITNHGCIFITVSFYTSVIVVQDPILREEQNMYTP